MTLLEVNKLMLNRLADFLVQLSDQDYQRQLTVFNGSSLGEHTRHTIEFYQCLIKQCKEGAVSYDSRERKQALQQSTVQAIAAIHQIVNSFNELDLDKGLLLEVNATDEDGPTEELNTNIHRELHYVLDHAIHHMALIKIGVNTDMPHVKLPSDFGVAPSTIRSRSNVQG